MKWHDLNKDILKSKVVVDAVVPEMFYAALGREYGNAWLKSFEGRSTNTTLVSPDFFDHDVDIIDTGDRIVFANMFDEMALEIRDTTMVPMFRGLFNLVQAGGKKINLTEHVRNLQNE